ncbi:MAG: glycosyltransferase, partial [Clostridia bacterium]|nr:glycosyltransferase [Clostridia bacterium]
MKILLCHMWMVIGGAETHVLELARGLAARGHDVTVASNGGVYVEALEAAGVRHVTVPLHTKKPSAM